jgi:NADH:ubiquinone oxidoreductase subunit D
MTSDAQIRRRDFSFSSYVQLWAAVLQWTSAHLHKRGKRELSLDQLHAYIGLELAMSIVKIGGIRNYWDTTMFTGHSDFCDTVPE